MHSVEISEFSCDILRETKICFFVTEWKLVEIEKQEYFWNLKMIGMIGLQFRKNINQGKFHTVEI